METAQMPQLEVFNRVLELPVVELALAKSATTYSRIKDSHHLVNWALSTAELSLSTAKKQAAPYAKRLEAPIGFVDRKLCSGLDGIERRVPIVKEQPETILENAYMLALQKMQPAVSTISYANDFLASHTATIRDVSWNKMNQLLSTHYGTAAVHGLDNTAGLIDMLLDKYFPPVGEENFVATESVSAEEDKLLHTLQTVGRLSNKAARRVYANVIYRLKTVNKENLLAFLVNLVEFLQLAYYVGAINERVHGAAKSTKINTSCCTRRSSKQQDKSKSKPSDTTTPVNTNGINNTTNTSE